jgi:hypothetical protein
MSRYQVITLCLAILVAVCYCGVGVAIAKGSALGIIGCLVLSVVFMGAGFTYKRKHLR